MAQASQQPAAEAAAQAVVQRTGLRVLQLLQFIKADLQRAHMDHSRTAEPWLWILSRASQEKVLYDEMLAVADNTVSSKMKKAREALASAKRRASRPCISCARRLPRAECAEITSATCRLNC